MNIAQKIRERAEQFGIKPQKSLGQNFLTNEPTYQKIVDSAMIQPTDIIIEIGPGLGTLTEELAKTGARVIAIEKDRTLIGHLQAMFAETKNVTIIEGDALEFDIATLPIARHAYKVIGNIPYYITSNLLRTIFEQWPTPQLIIMMMQKEVVQRIVAKPPEMSLLAVSIQYYATPKTISYVSAGSFWPKPNVDSAIIRITPHNKAEGTGEHDRVTRAETDKRFFKVVKAGFAEKRKQLINNLSNGLSLSKEQTLELMNKASIDSRRRAETLTIAEWQNLATTIFGS